MHYSRIHVQYRDGSNPKGTRVVLSFRGCLGGVTQPAYTDAYGFALIGHAGMGEAAVIVSGKTRTVFRAPGETAVFI